MGQPSVLRPRPLTTLLCSAAWLASGLAPAQAGVIATHVLINYSEAASFADGIDRSLVLSDAQAARLVASRLGTWLGTDASFTLNASHAVSVGDPGVAVAPGTNRPLLKVTATATASGGLLADQPYTLDLGATWQCPGTATRCNDNLTFHTLPQATPALLPATAPAQALQPWRLQASATPQVLADGVTLKEGALMLSGRLSLAAQYQSKTPEAYLADALAATAGVAAPATAARWGAAAADVQALRAATWTDQPVDRSLQAARNPELETAQRLLAVARDSATLLQTGATPGAGFASSFQLTQQLWDLAATVQPALGHARATNGSDDLLEIDRVAELAVLRATLGAHDDASFLAGLADALAHPATAGSAPVLTLAGSVLGLDASAQVAVYLAGDPFSGSYAIDLPGASRHALWRTGFDRIELLQGPAAGLLVLDAASGTGETLTVDGGEVYLGETFGGLLALSGGGAPAQIRLNNAYGPQFLVVASWDVGVVPEPGSAVLMLAGAAGLAGLAGWKRRRRAG